MTEGPPSSAASSSKAPLSSIPNLPSTASSPSFAPPPLDPCYNGATISQPYSNWNPASSSGYVGYTAPTSTTPGLTTPNSNPYAAVVQSHTYSATQAPAFQRSYYKPSYDSPKIAKPSKGHPPTAIPQVQPQSLDAKTLQNWDQVIKKFLVKGKMTEAVKGFENDMLVLNSEWEQKIVSEVLREMVDDLQIILKNTTARKTQSADDTSMNVDPKIDTNGRPLDERKLEYIEGPNGTSPKTQSSINKSISQFLARTRARNDASNRAEFLKTLAEKKREFGERGADEGSLTSCARVDAKQIDRDKQIAYDIAKYGEGPLTKTTKPKDDVSNPSAASYARPVPPPVEDTPNAEDLTPVVSQRKRKLTLDSGGEELEAKASKPTRKRKGKGKEKEKDDARLARRELDEEATSRATSERHPGLDERISNIETHLAVRYVPTPPRTLLARLKFIEDHIVKLEKEYPPWAALHFNQPDRGWPPPPRATPIIVPVHLRSFASTPSVPPSTTNSVYPPPTVPSGQNSSAAGSSSATTLTNVKPRKSTSSLHKAVLERLEVQKAKNEMEGKGGGD